MINTTGYFGGSWKRSQGNVRFKQVLHGSGAPPNGQQASFLTVDSCLLFIGCEPIVGMSAELGPESIERVGKSMDSHWQTC